MNTATTPTPTLRPVKDKGARLDLQDVSIVLGRNWQFFNKLRSQGRFVDPSAKLGNTLLYSKSKVMAWARRNMTGIGGKMKSSA